jgi:cyclophilin family peptidyl-prolyl cis-trans isomerase/HEAT repeat protein
MKRSIIFTTLILIVLACGPPEQDILNEIKFYEYSRDANSQKFIPWLNSNNKKIRIEAIESLGRIQDSSTISWVGNRLNDKDTEVKEKAAFSIGQFFNSKAEELLIETIANEQDINVKSKIIESLGKVGTERSFSILQDNLQSGIPELEKSSAIATGLLAYRGFPLYKNIMTINTLLKKQSNPDFTWCLAYSLFRIGSPSELKNTYDFIDVPDPLTRYFIIQTQIASITTIKSPRFYPYRNTRSMKPSMELLRSPIYEDTLIKMLKDTCWYIRYATLQLIEVLKSNSLWDEVIETTNDPHPHVRAAALSAISKYKTKESEKFLQDFFRKTDNWRDRGITLVQFSQNNPRVALNIIEKEIEKLEWPENYYIIKSLELIDNQHSTSLLKEICNKNNLAQTTLALEILVNRENISLPFLLAQLSLNDPVIIKIISSKLGLIGDHSTVQPLLNSYNNLSAPADIKYMVAIIEALEKIKSTKAESFLENQLTSPYITIRNTSKKALATITGKDHNVPQTESKQLIRYDFPKVEYEINPRIILITTKGNIEIELYPKDAPVTVSSFINLVSSGFYDGIYFHRIVPTFVIQAGDPRGDGWGGPGYNIPCEYNEIFYNRGTVGMAHAGKDTGGSQFFITQIPQPRLNGKYTAFGKVVAGMDVVDKIEIFDIIIKAETIN